MYTFLINRYRMQCLPASRELVLKCSYFVPVFKWHHAEFTFKFLQICHKQILSDHWTSFQDVENWLPTQFKIVQQLDIGFRCPCLIMCPRITTSVIDLPVVEYMRRSLSHVSLEKNIIDTKNRTPKANNSKEMDRRSRLKRCVIRKLERKSLVLQWIVAGCSH